MRYKKALKKTGGGPPPKPPNQELIDVAAIIPNQMCPLENPYDCDSDLEEIYSKDADIGTTMEPNKIASETSEIRSTTVIGADSVPKRKQKDARSSLVDMEYEEHKIRLKTLHVQHETEILNKLAAKRKLEMMEEEHKIKITRLVNSGTEIVFENEVLFEK